MKINADAVESYRTTRKNLANKICLIIPGAAKDGLLTTWVYFALDAAYWKYLISQLGNKKTEWTGTEPNRFTGDMDE